MKHKKPPVELGNASNYASEYATDYASGRLEGYQAGINEAIRIAQTVRGSENVVATIRDLTA